MDKNKGLTMIKYYSLSVLLILMFGCKSANTVDSPYKPVSEFTIAFGSCNKHTLKNELWDDILDVNPDIWIWGGDNIYADSPDARVISQMYDAQKKVEGYRKLRKEIPVTGTWDDHDYGKNDGGVEWSAKVESQQAFLDFLEVPSSSMRRQQPGIYTSHNISLPLGNIKIIILDTRYFRTALSEDTSGTKRYVPNAFGDGTILGDDQWNWLESELKNTNANFNVIVSSIQFLSDKHGYETWGNFPHEVVRLKELIAGSGAEGVFILSGDRHISEFSRTSIENLSYPLIDFTSSGLTHAYKDFTGEPNPYRLGEVVNTESFGLVRFNLTDKKVRFQIIGDQGSVLGEIEQQY